jgi:hypothetical protein
LSPGLPVALPLRASLRLLSLLDHSKSMAIFPLSGKVVKATSGLDRDLVPNKRHKGASCSPELL